MSEKKSKLKIVKAKAGEEDEGRVCSFCGKKAGVVFVGPTKAIICEKCVQSAVEGFGRVV